MYSKQKNRKAKAGLFLIASPRFKNLGEGLPHGTYGERKAMQVEEILGTLDFLDVIFPGIVYEREDAVRAMERFYLEKADFIIAEFLSWSEDFAWIRFLRDMPEVPMIFVNVAKERMAFRDTLDEDDFIEYLCSGTLVGSLEGSGSLPRVGRKHVRIVMGSREEVTGRIRTFAAAARVRSLLRQSNLGLLANYNEAMWSTYFDPYALFTKIGPEIHFLPYSTYGEVIDGVNDTVLNAYCDELTARYRMMDDVDPEKFRASVRASIGLAEMARMSDSDILVFNDIDQAMFRLVGLRAGFYHPWFNENISVLVPEADTGAGLICYILKLLSGRHVNFLEPFHIESEFGTFAGGHAGPNDHNDSSWQGNVVIARDVRFAKTDYRYAGGSVRMVSYLSGAENTRPARRRERTLQTHLRNGRVASGRPYSDYLFAQHFPARRSRRTLLRTDSSRGQHTALRGRRRRLPPRVEGGRRPDGLRLLPYRIKTFIP